MVLGRFRFLTAKFSLRWVQKSFEVIPWTLRSRLVKAASPAEFLAARYVLPKLDQNFPLACAAGRFWLVLRLGGLDRAETEQGWRTVLELRFNS